MKVLLSIKPEYAEKIFKGNKLFEYRRMVFKDSRVSTVVVYASHPIQRVIGEFKIDSILRDEPKLLWEKTGYSGGISEDKFFKYFAGKTHGYAIKIKETKEYDRAFPLEEIMVHFAPQSYVYL